MLPDGATGPLPDGAPLDATVDGPNGQEAAVNTCASAQTQFGNTAQGDSNPNFTSGVGVRTATSLLVFSGSSAPTDAGDGGTDNSVYMQEFDPATANSRGPAQPLFATPPGAGFALESASIAPTGEIAIAFNYGGGYVYRGGTQTQAGLYGAFLAPSPDASAGLAIEQITQIESAEISGQPHVTWSVATGAFVFSWEYVNEAWFVGTKSFHPSGQSAGGTDPVPTDNASATVVNAGYEQEQGSVGVGVNFVGVAFQSTNAAIPNLTILDQSGAQVGSAIPVATVDQYWVTVGATATGFVYVYDNANAVSEAFLPTSPDAGIVESDAGFSGFSFTGSIVTVQGWG
jgi:hypothetical protein